MSSNSNNSDYSGLPGGYPPQQPPSPTSNTTYQYPPYQHQQYQQTTLLNLPSTSSYPLGNDSSGNYYPTQQHITFADQASVISHHSIPIQQQQQPPPPSPGGYDNQYFYNQQNDSFYHQSSYNWNNGNQQQQQQQLNYRPYYKTNRPPPPERKSTIVKYPTQKTVLLDQNGNLAVQTNVPTPIKNLFQTPYTPKKSTTKQKKQLPQLLHEKYNTIPTEHEYLKYTAVVGDPDEYKYRGYSLRCSTYGRNSEIMVIVTMYNEDDGLFKRTWKSICKNINYLCKQKDFQSSPNNNNNGNGGNSGGDDDDGKYTAWKKIVVCIVSDGREKINHKTLYTLGLLGVYQEGHMKTSINSLPTTAHVFEYTTLVNLDSIDSTTIIPTGGTTATTGGNNSNSSRSLGAMVQPVQIIFCLKEKNAKKINSHRWAFNAFCPLIKPKVCILLDVGTKPTDPSFYRLWKAFDDPCVAGACGEIYTELGKGCSKLFNPLVAGQNFEYKMSNILDKPFESMFGFISVLPGAFSAYRYKALLNDSKGKGPLDKYFLGETLHLKHGDLDDPINIKKANMYLAEDRVLCFELVTKRNQNYLLRYVFGARAETDVPNTVPEFISQRRRWLNGSFFASVYSISHFYQIFRTNHSILRKCLLLFQTIYNMINLIFNFTALGNMYLIFHFLISDHITLSKFLGIESSFVQSIVFDSIQYIYLAALGVIFLASLGNRPQGSKLLYAICFMLFTIVMGVMLFVSAVTVYSVIPAADEINATLLDRPYFRDIIISMGATYGLYFLSSLLYGEPWHMITSFIQYLLLLPSFVNILMVYAFCNLHDISWGTKGDNNINGNVKDEAPVMSTRTLNDHHANNSSTTKQDKYVQQQQQQQVVTDFPCQQGEIDDMYTKYISNVYNPTLTPETTTRGGTNGIKKKKKRVSDQDYFKMFRTRVVLLWVFINFALVVAMTFHPTSTDLVIDEETGEIRTVFRDDGGASGCLQQPLVVASNGEFSVNYYLTVILWAIAGLSTCRFLGSLSYLVSRLF